MTVPSLKELKIKLTNSNIENFNAVLSAVLVILGDCLSSTWLQTSSAIPIAFLQNSIPSNKSSFGVVLMKNDVVGPNMVLI